VGQLMMLGITLPVDMLQGASVTTVETDPSALFYLVVALLASAIALIFIHPGPEMEGPRRPYAA